MSSYGHPQNGLTGIMMRPVWDSAETTRKFRREHHSSWVFPDWVPSSSDWTPVPPSEVETYLPQELQSAAFTVCREGMKGQPEAPVQRLSRFESSPPHPERWDTSLFVGGPVWALEWCPTPDGAPATQYVALACHRGMEDQHQVHRTYTEPGLVQLWDVSELEYNCRPGSKPTLSLGVALDSGSVWQLKWCPAGCWETPNHVPKPPVLPRLGLLAVATSNGVVTVYSLPHPGTLLAHSKLPASGSDSVSPAIYKARGVVTLKLGSFRAPRHDNSGVPLCIDWLPTKPHNIMVIGFYDGVVGLWDLTTRSALLRVRQPGESMCLLPYRVFLAHQHAVRAVSFCHASRFLLVTGGDDRLVKTWDLRRIWDPVYVMKRNLTNEVYWLLNAPGLMMAQETAFVSRGSHGVHYVDHQQRSIMLAPRTATLWSISYSDWLHSVATSDTQGDVILALLPQLDHNHPYLKRSLARRFPVYLSSLVPSDTAEEENEGMGGGDAEEQEGGEREGAAAEGPNEEKVEGGGGRAGRRKSPRLLLQTYKETSKRNVLQLTDSDMRSFAGSEGRAVWKRMRDMEATTKMSLDHMPLAALHKVRFNPNMTSHPWVASAGRAGLVRLNCLRSMISSHMKKMIGEQQAQFKTECAPLRQEVEVQPDDQAL